MFSLNSANSVTKKLFNSLKGLEPATSCVRGLKLATSCVRDQDGTTAPVRHM